MRQARGEDRVPTLELAWRMCCESSIAGGETGETTQVSREVSTVGRKGCLGGYEGTVRNVPEHCSEP